MEEKMYHTVKSSGIMNIVAGAFAIAVGISALISGIRRLPVLRFFSKEREIME